MAGAAAPSRSLMRQPASWWRGRTSPSARRDAGGRAAYLVGQDGEGHWLAVEVHGLGGGIFTSRGDALRYARDESRHQPGAVRFADAPVRLFAA